LTVELATQSKEKPLPEKIAAIEEQIGYCTDCVITWCLYRGKIVYCSLKYRGIRGFYCENGYCIDKFD